MRYQTLNNDSPAQGRSAGFLTHLAFAKECGTSSSRWMRAAIGFAGLSLLTGCLNSTQVVRNDAIKPREYSTVILVQPKEDPRKVMPQVVDGFRQLGYNVKVAASADALSGRQGTGFFLTSDGFILTNAHVVGDEKTVKLWSGNVEGIANLVAKDDERDLALLKLQSPAPTGISPAPVSFRAASTPKLGEAVTTLGFPISQFLGKSIRLGGGQVTSVQGFQDNPAQFQFSAQIQPGSSGSPLFDSNGLVVGVVSQTLNPWAVADQTGALPQNVNFAIKGEGVLAFLKEKAPMLHQRLSMNQSASIDRLEGSIVRLRAGQGPLDDAPQGNLIAVLDYESFWDIWYRFRYFIVRIFDPESGQLLLVAGQGRDNLLSSEPKVIEATFEKIRSELKR